MSDRTNSDSRVLYDGVAALKLMTDPALRAARDSTHIETLRVLIGMAREEAEKGASHAFTAAQDAEAAAEYARKLGRELTVIAKRMKDAAALADEGFTTGMVEG